MSHEKEKLEYFDKFMEFDHVFVYVNAKDTDVIVPKHLKNNPALTLQLSYLFQGEISHDKTAITSYLKFSGEYQKCTIPWKSIWGMKCSNKEEKHWPEDIPKELLIQATKQQLADIGKRLFKRKSKNEKQKVVAIKTTTPKEDTRKNKKSHLRLIKK